MNRRDVIVAGAAAAVAQSVVAATGCKAEGGTTAAAVSLSAPEKALADSLSPCIESGEICLTHCLGRLSQGDSSLGACAARVREMLAVCAAVQTLVLAQSSHLPRAAALCANVCESCRVECAKHAKHHAECRACEAACELTVTEARRIAAA